jgi:hypothetical protein
MVAGQAVGHYLVTFNVFFATPNPTLAYAWADQPNTASYVPNSFYRSHPSGGAITIPSFWGW